MGSAGGQKQPLELNENEVLQKSKAVVQHRALELPWSAAQRQLQPRSGDKHLVMHLAEPANTRHQSTDQIYAQPLCSGRLFPCRISHGV